MSLSPCSSDWMTNLPMVLLGIRSSTRDDSLVSPAHLTYGAPLRLPGEFVAPSTAPVPSPSAFAQQLRQSLRDMSPFAAEFHHGVRGAPEAVPSSLSSCPAVFVRVDAVKRPLTPPYSGPFEVLERTAKTFVLLRGDKPWTVSVDRLKPYFSADMSAPQSASTSDVSLSPSASFSPPAAPAQRAPPPAATPAPAPAPAPLTTRAGRTIRPPLRYSA